MRSSWVAELRQCQKYFIPWKVVLRLLAKRYLLLGDKARSSLVKENTLPPRRIKLILFTILPTPIGEHVVDAVTVSKTVCRFFCFTLLVLSTHISIWHFQFDILRIGLRRRLLIFDACWCMPWSWRKGHQRPSVRLSKPWRASWWSCLLTQVCCSKPVSYLALMFQKNHAKCQRFIYLK